MVNMMTTDLKPYPAYKDSGVEWLGEGDRIEKLWGPDYCGRYDLYVFHGETGKHIFGKIPTDLDLPVLDKRSEIELFDVEEGYRSIGVTRLRRR